MIEIRFTNSSGIDFHFFPFLWSGTNLQRDEKGCELGGCTRERRVILICGKIPHTRFLPRRRANADEVIQVLLSERLRASVFSLSLSFFVSCFRLLFEHVRAQLILESSDPSNAFAVHSCVYEHGNPTPRRVSEPPRQSAGAPSCTHNV